MWSPRLSIPAEFGIPIAPAKIPRPVDWRHRSVLGFLPTKQPIQSLATSVFGFSHATRSIYMKSLQARYQASHFEPLHMPMACGLSDSCISCQIGFIEQTSRSSGSQAHERLEISKTPHIAELPQIPLQVSLHISAEPHSSRCVFVDVQCGGNPPQHSILCQSTRGPCQASISGLSEKDTQSDPDFFCFHATHLCKMVTTPDKQRARPRNLLQSVAMKN